MLACGQQYESLIRKPYYLSTVKVSKFNLHISVLQIHPSFKICQKIMKNYMHKAAGVQFYVLASAGLGLNKERLSI